MRYYISDLHFFHNTLNHSMDYRGFESAEAMNEYMISQWNRKVRPNDDVIILGDFSIGKGKQTNEILSRLHGKKALIIGNHDKYLDDKSFDRSLFAWTAPYEEFKDNKRKVILSHYPIMCYNGQYRKSKDGLGTSYMLYGHVHDTFDESLIQHYQNLVRKQEFFLRDRPEKITIPCQMINCFCMFSDYQPLTLDEWIAVDEKRRQSFRISKSVREVLTEQYTINGNEE